MTTLQEYLNNKYPTPREKETLHELNLEKINQEREQVGETELLAGGELDLTAFTNLEEIEIYRKFLKTPITKLSVEGLTKLKVLIWPDQIGDSEEEKKLWTELGIADLSTENNKKRKTVKEVRRLAELKSIPVHFGPQSEESESAETNSTIYLSLDKKDKTGHFSPPLIFWTLSQELASISIGGDKTIKTPDFWKKLAEELNWVKENLTEEFKKDFENLLNPATFPHQQLEMKDLLSFYYPNLDSIPDNQTSKTTVNQAIVDQTWLTIQEKLMELLSQELNKNPTDEEKPKLALKATIESSADQQYTIQIDYHSQHPHPDQIKELITITPLQLEIEHLKNKQEQLPTAENFIKLTKQNQALENSLQDLTDEDEYQKIKTKINQIK